MPPEMMEPPPPSAPPRFASASSNPPNPSNPDADPDATLLVGQWLDSRHSQVLPQDEYHSAASGKDPDFG